MAAPPTTFDTPGIGRPPRLMAWLLLAPLLLWLLLFVVAPTVIMIVVSFSQRSGLGEVIYDSPTLGNYARIFTPAQFWPLAIAAGAGLATGLAAALVPMKSHRWHDRMLSSHAAFWPVLAVVALLLPVLAYDWFAFPHYAGGIDFEVFAPGMAELARGEFLRELRFNLLLVPLCGALAAAVLWTLLAPSGSSAASAVRLPLALGMAVGAGVFWGMLNLVLLVHVRESEYATLPFVLIVREAQMLKIFVISVNYAAFATAICALMGYPVAYFIGKAPERWRNILLMLVMIPFWTSFLVRTYAWVTILRSEGVLNSLLMSLGWISDPLNLYPSQTGVMIGLVYTYLPFMILPIYTSVERLDNALVEAAFDLGASPVRAFNSVIFPLTKPGVIAGILLVFVPAIGMFAVNDILGGRQELLIGNVIEKQFTAARDKPFGAALGMLLLVVFIATYYLTTRRRSA